VLLSRGACTTVQLERRQKNTRVFFFVFFFFDTVSLENVLFLVLFRIHVSHSLGMTRATEESRFVVFAGHFSIIVVAMPFHSLLRIQISSDIPSCILGSTSGAQIDATKSNRSTVDMLLPLHHCTTNRKLNQAITKDRWQQ
jgi:hypothetical protein